MRLGAGRPRCALGDWVPRPAVIPATASHWAWLRDSRRRALGVCPRPGPRLTAQQNAQSWRVGLPSGFAFLSAQRMCRPCSGSAVCLLRPEPRLGGSRRLSLGCHQPSAGFRVSARPSGPWVPWKVILGCPRTGAFRKDTKSQLHRLFSGSRGGSEGGGVQLLRFSVTPQTAAYQAPCPSPTPGARSNSYP